MGGRGSLGRVEGAKWGSRVGMRKREGKEAGGRNEEGRERREWKLGVGIRKGER